MAELPRLHSDSSSHSIEMNMGTQKISVSDHMGNGKSDSFIVDMESFSNGGQKDSDVFSTNSRITLQRNLSRKGTHRGAGDRDSLLVSCSSSPRGPSSSTLEQESAPSQSLTAAINQQHNRHHQTTMNTTMTAPENRCNRWCNTSLGRSAWFSHPKRVLLFFATLSSVGTMLLIFFTLTAGN